MPLKFPLIMNSESPLHASWPWLLGFEFWRAKIETPAKGPGKNVVPVSSGPGSVSHWLVPLGVILPFQASQDHRPMRLWLD